jgi:hypothetical protein
MDRFTVAAILALIAIPFYAVPTTIRDVGLGRDVSAAPRQTAIVRNKWVVAAGRYTQNWVTIELPAGGKWDMTLPPLEWGFLRVGGPMTVAVLPGGKPQSVNAGVNPSSQWLMLALEAAGFLAAASFLWVRLHEGRPRGSDLSPEATLARRAARPGAPDPPRPYF